MKISYAITVCNEIEEIKKLIPFLLEHKRDEDEIVVQQDADYKQTSTHTPLTPKPQNPKTPWQWIIRYYNICFCTGCFVIIGLFLKIFKISFCWRTSQLLFTLRQGKLRYMWCRQLLILLSSIFWKRLSPNSQRLLLRSSTNRRGKRSSQHRCSLKIPKRRH